jgi:hypothetical protein
MIQYSSQANGSAPTSPSICNRGSGRQMTADTSESSPLSRRSRGHCTAMPDKPSNLSNLNLHQVITLSETVSAKVGFFQRSSQWADCLRRWPRNWVSSTLIIISTDFRAKLRSVWNENCAFKFQSVPLRLLMTFDAGSSFARPQPIPISVSWTCKGVITWLNHGNL